MKNIVFINFLHYTAGDFYDNLLRLQIDGSNIFFVDLSSETSLLKIRSSPSEDSGTIYFAYARSPANDCMPLYEGIRAFDRNSPVVLCSSSERPQDIRASFLSGFTDFLPLPFSREDLIPYLTRLFDGTGAGEPDISSESSIIESTKDNRLANEDLIRSLVVSSYSTGIKSAKAKYELIANRFTTFAVASAEINLKIEDFSDNAIEELVAPYLEILYQHFDDDYLSGNYSFEFIQCLFNGKLCLILYSQNTDLKFVGEELIPFFESVSEHFYKHTNYTANIGISDIFSGMAGIPAAYADSIAVLLRGFYLRSHSLHLFRHDEVCSEFVTQVHDLQPVIDKLSKSKGIESFYEIFEQLLESFKESNIHPNYVRRSFLIIFNKFIYDNVSISHTAKNKMYFDHKIEKIVEYIGNAYDVILYFAKLIDELLYNTYSSRSISNEVIIKAETYILENYEKQLSLSGIADLLNINPNYMCELFKKHTGMKFHSYLTHIRIHNAKIMLSNTDKKIYEIGYLVGYPETVSFTRAFTRVQGISPKEYRRSMSGLAVISE
ncbi:MAG: helix-turn-helix domain-containing protein [Saccharofermentanales bacterium]